MILIWMSLEVVVIELFVCGFKSTERKSHENLWCSL